MSVAALVLAAGFSRRYAAATGGNKLLADFGGRAVIRCVVEAALASRCRPVVVVVGPDSEPIRTTLRGLGVRFVVNENPGRGLSSSLRTGIAALPAETSGAVILLADMPLIGAMVIDQVADALSMEPAPVAVVPTVQGEWAHPVGLGPALFDEISRLEGDAGARRLLKGRADVRLLPFDNQALLADTDTPEALAQARLLIDPS